MKHIQKFKVNTITPTQINLFNTKFYFEKK